MASFGSLAVGERRPSANRPTKSQTLGMVAAALGIERTEEERLAALRDSLGFAARVENPGQPASAKTSYRRKSLKRKICSRLRKKL